MSPAYPASALQRGLARPYDAGLLLLRVAVGSTMAAHGAQKLFGWFDGPGIDGIGANLISMGYPAGRSLALLLGLCETLGGLGLLLGLLTPLAAAMVLGTMTNAVAVGWKGVNADGFFAPTGIEYPLLIAAASAALAITGPGAYALDRFIPGLRRHRLSYGIGAVLLGLVAGVVTLLVRR